jgi:uncharacterized protein with NRDE domain
MRAEFWPELRNLTAFCKQSNVCTLALYFQVSDDYPVIVAANRDEHFTRPSAPPLLLATDPPIVGGKDLVSGGTWLGVNADGLLVGVINRRPPKQQTALADVRSRGLLCLDLLHLKDTAQCLTFLSAHKEERYQPFTLLFCDRHSAYVSANVSETIRSMQLTPGLHVFSNTMIHDERTEKMDRAYTLFAGLLNDKELPATPPDWILPLGKVLSDHSLGNRDEPREAICVHGESSGTVSSSIIFYSARESRFRTFFCSGPPCQNSFSERLRVKVR